VPNAPHVALDATGVWARVCCTHIGSSAILEKFHEHGVVALREVACPATLPGWVQPRRRHKRPSIQVDVGTVVAVGANAVPALLPDAESTLEGDGDPVKVPAAHNGDKLRVVAKVHSLDHLGDLGEEVSDLWKVPDPTPPKRIPVPHGAPPGVLDGHKARLLANLD